MTANGNQPEAAESSDTGSDAPKIDRTGPLSDLATTVDDDRADRDRDQHADDSSADFDALFDREDVTEIDSDRLWDRLDGDETVTADAEDEADAVPDDRDIRKIDTGSYCHQCEHFSDPPAVECTREGTDILELASLETFRVADCPVVREDEALEQHYRS